MEVCQLLKPLRRNIDLLIRVNLIVWKAALTFSVRYLLISSSNFLASWCEHVCRLLQRDKALLKDPALATTWVSITALVQSIALGYVPLRIADIGQLARPKP